MADLNDAGGHVLANPDEGRLLVSPAFWIGGALCLLVWLWVLT